VWVYDPLSVSFSAEITTLLSIDIHSASADKSRTPLSVLLSVSAESELFYFRSTSTMLSSWLSILLWHGKQRVRCELPSACLYTSFASEILSPTERYTTLNHDAFPYASYNLSSFITGFGTVLHWLPISQRITFKMRRWCLTVLAADVRSTSVTVCRPVHTVAARSPDYVQPTTVTSSSNACGQLGLAVAVSAFAVQRSGTHSHRICEAQTLGNSLSV